MTLISINPATGKTLKTYKEWNNKKTATQLTRSQHAFEQWKTTTIHQRCKTVKAIARLLKKNRTTYAHLMTLEMGKPITQAEAEIDKCIWVCDYYAHHGPQFLKKDGIPTEAQESYVQFTPLGIILGIMPWNFPFWQALRFLAPALIAGNVTLLKHASNVPQCAQALDDLITQSTDHKDIFRTLFLSSQNMTNILKNPHIAAISLTGSSTAGSAVAEQAGHHLKKVVLELGGSDPFIVLKDADINYAAEQAINARMLNTGQSCIAAKRFIIQKEIYTTFTHQLTQQVKNLIVGDPFDRATQVGPLARKDLLADVEQQVATSCAQGAYVQIGGKRVPNTSGYYYLPTVLTNIHPSMPVYHEEVFGPVFSLIKARDEHDALRIANHTQYGLGASIWTKDTVKAKNMASHIQAGMVFINDIVKSDPRLPFGGVKNSGYGRELSSYGIKEFVNIQTISIHKQPKQ